MNGPNEIKKTKHEKKRFANQTAHYLLPIIKCGTFALINNGT